MNPILAANLVSLGKDFLQSSLSPSIKIIPEDSNAFQEMLSEARQKKVAGASELSDVLRRLGVKNLEEVYQARENLKDNMLANPEIAAFKARNPDANLYVGRSPDGAIALRASNGETLSIDQHSQQGGLLSDYLALSNFLGKDISTDHPGEVILRI